MCMAKTKNSGLAQISYAEGLKCTPYSYTTEKKKKKKDFWAMVGFTLHTDIQHIYREVQKKIILFCLQSCCYSGSTNSQPSIRAPGLSADCFDFGA